MKRYVTTVPGSNHHIYKMGIDTYKFLDSGLEANKINSLLNDFMDMGGNIIDTSLVDIGGINKNVQDCQKIVGQWVSSSNRRENMYLISKSDYLISNRGNTLMDDLSKSLENLNVKYIDLFLIDGDDESTDVKEIIDKLEEIKNSGKILNYGCSNWKSYRIRQAMEYSRENNFIGFSVNQMLWNIACNNINDDKLISSYVRMDKEMLDVHKEFNIVAMPYSSLAGGFFANMYLNETEPGSIDMESFKNDSPYYNDENISLYENMKSLGEKYLAPPSWVALGYLFNQQIQTCPLISIVNLNQLKEGFEAIDRRYTFEDFSFIDMLSESNSFLNEEVLV